MMSMQEHSGRGPSAHEGISLRSRVGSVLTGFLVIAGALLFTEHQAHVLGLLVWLPLLAYPLKHVFMHIGYGHHGEDVSAQRIRWRSHSSSTRLASERSRFSVETRHNPLEPLSHAH